MSKQNKYSIDEVINVVVVRLANKLSLIFYKEALKPTGLSLQEWRTLVNLARIGDCHLRRLARMSGIDPAHTSRSLSLLEKKGLVKSFVDANDSRRKILQLTKPGQELVEEIWPQAKALTQAMREQVGEEKMDAFVETLDQLLEFTQNKLDHLPLSQSLKAAE